MAKVFFGQYLPTNNVRCQVTGKAFGPTLPKKVGYKVVVEDKGEKHTYVVYGREQAMQIRDRVDETTSPEGDMS